MEGLLNHAQKFIKRNSATILTCAGGVGLVATTGLAIKATPKAMTLLEEAKKEKGEDLTKLEVVKTVGVTYLPTILTGTATLACIFGANILNKRQQAALMSAYMLVDTKFKEYKDKVKEISYRYNVNSTFFEEESASFLSNFFKEKVPQTSREVYDDAVILHFAGHKPWTEWFNHSYLKPLWYEYANRTKEKYKITF